MLDLWINETHHVIARSLRVDCVRESESSQPTRWGCLQLRATSQVQFKSSPVQVQAQVQDQPSQVKSKSKSGQSQSQSQSPIKSSQSQVKSKSMSSQVKSKAGQVKVQIMSSRSQVKSSASLFHSRKQNLHAKQIYSLRVRNNVQARLKRPELLK